MAKATSGWNNRDLKITEKDGSRAGITSAAASGWLWRTNFKSISVRSRKRAGLVTALYKERLSEFKRMQAANINISLALLQCTAKALILAALVESPFHRNVQ